MTIEANIGPAREDRTMPAATGETDATQLPWLICRSEAILCALPVQHVIEVMRTLPIKRVTGVPPYVVGLSIIRGAPVPVVDVGFIVHGKHPSATRLITINATARIVALALDEVIGITAFAADALGQLSPLLRDAATDTIASIGALDGELLLFLRASRLVPADVLATLDAAGAPS